MMSNSRRMSKPTAAVIIMILALALVPTLTGPTKAAPSQPSVTLPPSSSTLPSLPGAPQSLTDNNISFAPVVTYSVGGGADSIATADFNSDGYPDLVTSNGSDVYVMLNNGDGTFAPPISYTVQNTPLYATVGDFNGDGKPDIAAINFYSGSVSILLNNGHGFNPAISSPAGNTPTAIVAADFNGDGKTDLGVVGSEDPELRILISNGDGTFQPPVSIYTGGTGQSLMAGDLNHDGKTDLVLATGSGVCVLLGNGDGTFQSYVNYSVRTGASGVALGDFNHDGNIDVAATTTSEVAVLLGNRDGTFQPYTYFPNPYQPFGISSGDFNLDGNLDLITDNSTGGISAYAGVGDGNFYYPNQFTGGIGANSPADMGNIQTILPSKKVSSGIGAYSPSVAVADFNHDGKPDIATFIGGVGVLINNTNPNQPTPTPSPTATPVSACGPSSLGPWATTGFLSSKPAYIAATSDGTFVYVGGGYYGETGGISAESGTVSRYEPATGLWSDLTSLPDNHGYDSMSAVYSPINNKLYFFGGLDFDQYGQNNTFAYDPVAHTWSSGQMPSERAQMASGYWNGKIYLVGGTDFGGADQAQVWEYDPVADTWNTSRANMPVALNSPGYGIVNGHIYVMGGGAYPNVYNAVYDYDIASNTWFTRTNMPMGVTGPGSAVVNGNIYLFGGLTSYAGLTAAQHKARSGAPDVTPPLNITQIYSPTLGSWTYGPQLREPRYAVGGTAVGSNVVAVGGINNYGSEVGHTERARVGNCQPQPTLTPTATGTPILPTPTDCANQFVDIADTIFYGAIHYLACAGVVNGTDATHYTPSGTATRGQFAKIVALGFGLPTYTPPGTPDFSDVHTGDFDYNFVESGFHAGILSGFDPGTCSTYGVAYPCFLPNIPITRGQLTKLVIGAAHYPVYTPSGGFADFTDVPSSNVFYASIETAYHKGIIAGYPDATFRPANPIRRDEMAQIVYKGVITP